MRSGGRRCADELPPATLPLADGARVPLDPWLAAMALSGFVSRQAAPSAKYPGWLEEESAGELVRWLVVGRTVAQIEVLRGDAESPTVSLTFADHHGVVPGRVGFRAGRERGELRLVEWHSAPPPARPAWVDEPPCEAPS